MRALNAVMLLWILTAPHWQESFGSAAACAAAASAWQGQVRDGERWVAREHQEALKQTDKAIQMFWGQAARRASEQIERAREARCVEVKS